MRLRGKAPRIIEAARRIGAPLALLLCCAPAAAEEARAVLAVSATVVPSCQVERRPGAPHSAAIACSTGASVSTRTATRHDEQPLDEAAEILGEPVRREGSIFFTSSVRPASGEPAADAPGDGAAPRYLTVTY